MNVLLDTHTLIWAADDPAKLSPVASALLRDPDTNLFLSVASVWEIGIKVGKHRLPLTLPFRHWIDQAFTCLDLKLLPINLDHIERQIGLDSHHGDPFDRMLTAQSLVDSLPLISCDLAFDDYGVRRIWN